MSEYECVVPEMEWNLMRQQQQTHVQVDQQNNNTRSSHLRPQHNLLDPIMSNNVEELTWENGQPSMHGRRNHTKPVWPGTKDTLESVVHQASHTHTNINPTYVSKMGDENNKLFNSSGHQNILSVETDDQTDESSILMMMMKKKRTRSESEQFGGTNNTSSSYSKGGDDHYHHQQGGNIRGSGSATFCKDEEDTTMNMTWASFDSSTTFNNKKTHFQHAAADQDSASLGISANQDEDGKTRTGQTGRSTSSRRSSRVAANHNQSERRRRDRINQKMRALQRLVPNAYKTDKASMLDEVIEYLKQLQAQVETAMSMRNMNNLPHFTMMPLGIAQAQHHQQQQQQLQLSLFSRMVGLGMGMGMLDANSVARAVAAQPLMHPAASSSSAAVPLNFVPPPFAAQPPVADARNNSPSLPVPADPFSAFLAQNMNIDLYNKMAALYRQQQMGSPSTTNRRGTREQ